MKDRTFICIEPVSIIVSLQDFKAACDACNIQVGPTMRVFKCYLKGRVESVIKARVDLPTDMTRAEEGYLTSNSAITNYLLMQYATDDNVATLDADIRSS